jgi:hypothetical protein
MPVGFDFGLSQTHKIPIIQRAAVTIMATVKIANNMRAKPVVSATTRE